MVFEHEDEDEDEGRSAISKQALIPLSQFLRSAQPGYFIRATPERRHVAGLRGSNGLSRQHAGAPDCWHSVLGMKYPG